MLRRVYRTILLLAAVLWGLCSILFAIAAAVAVPDHRATGLVCMAAVFAAPAVAAAIGWWRLRPPPERPAPGRAVVLVEVETVEVRAAHTRASSNTKRSHKRQPAIRPRCNRLDPK